MAAIVWLAIARPWTIRPIAEEPRGPFDAKAYVAKIWDARVVPDIRTHAIPFAAFQSQRMTGATPVSFEGIVADVNTSSRVGTASIDVAPADGRADALLMIGPVIRGTALRDALAFIQFTDFTNQIQFAAVANTLNERVLTTTLRNITPPALAGHRVAVVGVAWKESTAAGALPFVVPVQLSLGDRP
jgi:predicted lipoprotein